jgi:hypothetical protein
MTLCVSERSAGIVSYACRVSVGGRYGPVSLVVVIGLLLTAAGCSRTDTPTRFSVSADTANTVSAEDGGVTVDIPGSSLSGPGELTVEPVTDASGMDGWSIEIDGAELIGDATLRFPMPELVDGEPIPVVTYSESLDGPRSLAPNVTVDGDDLVVATDHFSNWFEDRWNDVRNAATMWLGERFDDLASAGNGSPPTCPNEQSVRDDGYTVTSDSGKRVYWCLGEDNGEPILKAVNARGYGVAAEYTPGMTVTRTDRDDLLGDLAKLLKSSPSKADNKVELLASGNQIEFDLANHGRRDVDGVMIQPDPGAYLLTALDFAVGTYAWVFKRAGAGDAIDKLRTALDGEQCLVEFSTLATTKLSNSDDVTRFFTTALRMAFDCAGIALEEADLGFILEGIVEPVLWVMDGVKLVIDGFVAAAETAFDPSGYRITVTHPTRAGKWTDPVVIVTTNSIGAAVLGMSDEEIETAANVKFEGRCTRCDSPPYVDMSPADQYPVYFSSTTNMNGNSYRSLHVSLRDGQQRSGQDVVTDEGFHLGGSVQELRQIYGSRLQPYESIGMYTIKGYKVDGPDGYIIFNAADTNGKVIHEFWVKQRLP